ncbi:nitroreductase family protein [Cohnella cellulosilytica]|uniref:Nitroreductase family protein n=1 Tax=Cohnella cellulosilytica TaxID=986710 RepID=A0ABW2FAI4_9BACL
MNFSQLIKERRTIRRFKPSPVQQQLVLALLEQAATLWGAEGSQNWRCMYYDSTEAHIRLAESMLAKVTASQLGKFIPSKMTELLTKPVLNTPALLVFIAAAGDNQRQSDENYAAVCSIMQNLQLLGWEAGLGMLWYTEPFLNNPSFFEEIGLQPGERFAGILNIGYFDRAPRARSRTPAERNWTEFTTNSQTLKDNEHSYVPSESILEKLNIAVWAPNDGLREPWRFIYVTDDEAVAKLQPSRGNSSPSFLVVVEKKETDPHKQGEDYAAICCLIQNFDLLAKAEDWDVRRTIPEWVYEPQPPIPLKIHQQEKIVAVLEIGKMEQRPRSSLASPALNVTRL